MPEKQAGKGFPAFAKLLQKRILFCLRPSFTLFSEIFFGSSKGRHLHLRQFFQNNLSRKAEGYGPLKPWQPYQISHLVEGANSILNSLLRRVVRREISQRSSLILNRISIPIKLILTYRMGFFCTPAPGFPTLGWDQ
jgi:hypothetical protein